MKAFPSHLAQYLSSHVEQGSQPALALFRGEKSQRKLKNLSKPSPCTAALNLTKLEAWDALSHPTAGASSSSEREMSEPPRGSGRGVGVQGQAGGTAGFSFLMSQPWQANRVEHKHTRYYRENYPYQTKFAFQHGELGETDKEKGKKELKERPLFFSERTRAGSCRAGLSESSLPSPWF